MLIFSFTSSSAMILHLSAFYIAAESKYTQLPVIVQGLYAPVLVHKPG